MAVERGDDGASSAAPRKPVGSTCLGTATTTHCPQWRKPWHDPALIFRRAASGLYEERGDGKRGSGQTRGAAEGPQKVMAEADGAATVRRDAEAILSIDFTDMLAQKTLHQSCKLLHDDACDDCAPLSASSWCGQFTTADTTT